MLVLSIVILFLRQLLEGVISEETKSRRGTHAMVTISQIFGKIAFSSQKSENADRRVVRQAYF